MQPAGAKDLGGEVELAAPVGNDVPAEKVLGPAVHLYGNLFGYLKKEWITGDSQLEAALVVERHDGDLAEGVFTIEHPAVGP